MHYQAAEEYKKAVSELKSKPQASDQSYLKTLELLAKTHERNAKLCKMRDQSSVASIKKQIIQLKQSKKADDEKAQREIKRLNALTEQQAKEIDILKTTMKIVPADSANNVREFSLVFAQQFSQKMTKYRLKLDQLFQSLSLQLNQTHGKVISLGDKMINIEADPFAKMALKEAFKLDEIKKQVELLGDTLSNMEKYEVQLKKQSQKLQREVDKTFAEKNQVDISMKDLALISYTAQG